MTLILINMKPSIRTRKFIGRLGTYINHHNDKFVEFVYYTLCNIYFRE